MPGGRRAAQWRGRPTIGGAGALEALRRRGPPPNWARPPAATGVAQPWSDPKQKRGGLQAARVGPKRARTQQQSREKSPRRPGAAWPPCERAQGLCSAALPLAAAAVMEKAPGLAGWRPLIRRCSRSRLLSAAATLSAFCTLLSAPRCAALLCCCSVAAWSFAGSDRLPAASGWLLTVYGIPLSLARSFRQRTPILTLPPDISASFCSAALSPASSPFRSPSWSLSPPPPPAAPLIRDLGTSILRGPQLPCCRRHRHKKRYPLLHPPPDTLLKSQFAEPLCSSGQIASLVCATRKKAAGVGGPASSPRADNTRAREGEKGNAKKKICPTRADRDEDPAAPLACRRLTRTGPSVSPFRPSVSPRPAPPAYDTWSARARNHQAFARNSSYSSQLCICRRSTPRQPRSNPSPPVGSNGDRNLSP